MNQIHQIMKKMVVTLLAGTCFIACNNSGKTDSTQLADTNLKAPALQIPAQEGILHGPVKSSTISIATDVYSTSDGEWFYNDALDNRQTTIYNPQGQILADSIIIGKNFNYKSFTLTEKNTRYGTGYNHENQKLIYSIKIHDDYNVSGLESEITHGGDTIVRSSYSIVYKDALHYTTIFTSNNISDTFYTAYQNLKDTIYMKVTSNNPILAHADTMIILKKDKYNNPLKTLLLNGSKNLILSSHTYYE